MAKMVKWVASGLLVLAVALIALSRVTWEPVAIEAVAPTLPTKVRDREATFRNATLPDLPVLNYVIDLEFTPQAEWFPQDTKDRYLGRLDYRLRQLEGPLALSPSQLEKLAAWRQRIAERVDASKTTAETNQFANPRELEAFLRTLLDGDQAVALATFKREEQSQRAASLTASQFSKLAKAVGLSAELQVEVASDVEAVGPQAQLRADVAKAIAADIEAVSAFRLDDPRPMEVFSSNFDKDPQALGVEQLMWECLGEDGAILKVDHPRKRQFIKELGARIDARVASLEPVLTPEQLAAYRDYLRKNWSETAWQQIFFPPLDQGP